MEGTAILMANLSRVGSGVLSDIIKSRVKVGQCRLAVSKPVFKARIVSALQARI
jgi:hypothetical protein